MGDILSRPARWVKMPKTGVFPVKSQEKARGLFFSSRGAERATQIGSVVIPPDPKSGRE